MGRKKKQAAVVEVEPDEAIVVTGGRTRGGRVTARRLFDDEEVVMVARPNRLSTFPKFVLTLGLYALWRRKDTAVLTNQRVLLGKGVLRRSERSIPLRNIEDVSYARSGLNSYVELTINDRYRGQPINRIGPLSSRAAHRLCKEILRRT